MKRIVQTLTSSSTVGDYLIARLRAWSVDRIYGYPGDGINGIMGALNRSDNRPRFIQARHEEMAALMACAHAKFTGEVGVCLATSGPGATHLLTGLYDARMDHAPVLAIVGQAQRRSLGSFYQQEIDLTTLLKDVSEYVVQVSTPDAVRHCVDVAMRVALARRTVTCLIFPSDLQDEPAVESPPREHGSTFSGVGYSPPRLVPRDEDLQQAADILNQAKRVTMLLGAGAIPAGEVAIEVADRLGAGVCKALLGRAALPDDVPYVTSSIGLLGTRPSWEMMQQCDALLVVGSSFPYAEFLPPEGQALGIQIDMRAEALSLRYPMTVNLHGESRATLEALLPLLTYKADRSWQQSLTASIEQWWKLLEKRAMMLAKPVNPQRVFWELSSRLPDGCILTCDSGSAANWFARDLKMRKGMMASLSGNLATMGTGCPYAVAAKFAFPDRVVIAMVGDGAMQMNGNNVLITVAKYWQMWTDPRLVVLVLNNHDLNQVTWEQRIFQGDPKFGPSQDIPAFDYARYAESLGLLGMRVETPEQIGPAWDRVLQADRPAVIDAVVDPEVPPLPPHIEFEQAVHFWKSVLKGDPNSRQMISQSIRQMLAHWKPD